MTVGEVADGPHAGEAHRHRLGPEVLVAAGPGPAREPQAAGPRGRTPRAMDVPARTRQPHTRAS